MRPLDLIKFLQMVLDFNIVIDRDYELKSQLGCKFSKKNYLFELYSLLSSTSISHVL